jgi:hypothetical protein
VSPFDFKLAFQNLKGFWQNFLKQSCKAGKVEELLFLEIFNFFRKFESNFKSNVVAIS